MQADTRVHIGLPSAAHPCGVIKVSGFLAPSLHDGCLPEVCRSRKFESAFYPHLLFASVIMLHLPVILNLHTSRKFADMPLNPHSALYIHYI